MIDKALQIIPGVRRLQVSLQYSHDGDIPRILLDAIVPPETEDFSAEDRWWAWRHDQFPPSVLEHFCLLMIPDFPDAR
jgi:hypothetical protein